MIDVTIIGGGRSGCALAEALSGAGLKVAVVESIRAQPEDFCGEWIEGLGTVSGRNVVAVLDAATADERRILPSRVIVLAVGQLNSYLPSRMLGISKLGIEFDTNTDKINTDEMGATRVGGIFATGSCASGSAAGLTHEIVRYCANLPVEETV